MSKKGQALIEFILIMPVMVYLILVFVDFSLILSTKNKLDNNVSNLVMEYKETGLCPSEALCEFSDKYEKIIIYSFIRKVNPMWITTHLHLI